MKRKVALRNHRAPCIQCNSPITKGSVYYNDRVTYDNYGTIVGFTYKYCARCRYYNEQHKVRYKRFQGICEHPYEFLETIWSYIPGECVKEPDYDRCTLCGAKF